MPSKTYSEEFKRDAVAYAVIGWVKRRERAEL